jgi:hypothetical protein
LAKGGKQRPENIILKIYWRNHIVACVFLTESELKKYRFIELLFA